MARNSIQNANASLVFNGTTTAVSRAALTGMSAGFTVACWFKFTAVTIGNRLIQNDTGTSDRSGMSVSVDNRLKGGYYNGSYVGAKSSSPLTPGNWYHGVYTYNGSVGNIYINGVLDNAGTTSPSLSAIGTLRLGDPTSLSLGGNMSQAVILQRAITATEVLALYQSGTAPAAATAVYPLNEGAGTIAYDTSGNGNDGTITSGTWTRDAPTKTRKTVNDNLVYNGDFEIAPVVNAATTTSNRFIDGTAGGSTTTDVCGWGLYTKSGTSSAIFDKTNFYTGNSSMKISTLATASYIEVGPYRDDSASGRFLYNISVLPNTSYTASFYMKTLYVSGDATTGPGMNFIERTGDSTFVANNLRGTSVKITTDWTQYTVTFTTTATTRFVSPTMRIYGHQGTGTLIMDAWFDDITLTPTTATTRTATTGPYRKTVENLVANGDFEYAPAFTAATDTSSRFIDGTANSGNGNDNPYKWRSNGASSQFAIQYDTTEKYTGTASLKLSLTNSAGNANATWGNQNFVNTMIPVLPSTSYTMSGWMKTDSVFTSAATIGRVEYNGASGVVTTGATSTASGTTNWTFYTSTFTTGAATRYIQPRLQLATGAVSSAWFDDIKLTKTTPDARTLA